MASASDSLIFSFPLNCIDRAAELPENSSSGSVPCYDRFVVDRDNIGLKYLLNLTDAVPQTWPIVLSGPAGTGKTAIAKHLANGFHVDADKPPFISTGVDFCRRFANAVETNSTDRFRNSVLSSTVFVLDALEGFKRHGSAQEEFAALLDLSQIPVIITAEQSCLNADWLAPRLCSRLSAGLCLNVNLPGLEARRFLICESTRQFGIELADDAHQYLAEVMAVSYPRIRQFFVRFRTWLLSTGRGTDGRLDKTLISEFISPTCGKSLKSSVDAVVRDVARTFKVKVVDLKSDSRRQSTVLARGVAAYLLRRHLPMSFSQIGNVFGGRDHSTIMHAVKRVENMITDKHCDLRIKVDRIEQSMIENTLLEAIE